MPQFRSNRRALLALMAVALLAPACSRPVAPEEAVRRTLTEIEQAAQERSVKGLKEHLSESYQDAEGNDRQAVGALLTYYFFQHRSVHVLSRIKEITITEPGRARVDLVAALAGRAVVDPSQLAAGGATIYRFDFHLAEESKDEWKIIEASWRPAEAGDFF